MEHEIKIKKSGQKDKMYAELLPQIKALLQGEEDNIANMANVCAALKTAFDFLWVGFYLVKGKELVLGPFQGPVACTRIGYGKGVCGTSWKNNKTIIVDDVEKFPGHIACSSSSKSEIVVPLVDENGRCIGVLDIDSQDLASFDLTDQTYLEQVAKLLCLGS